MNTPDPVSTVYRFADCELDLLQFELRRAGEVVHVEPQVLDVLGYLIANRDRLVAKTELLDAVWGDRFVSESALTSRLKEARRAVGDDGQRQEVIATVHGRGYRFVAAVEESTGPMPWPLPTSTPIPQDIRYCVSPDGVCVAYAAAGSGTPLVKAANWLTHLELEWDSPIWSHWLHAFADRHHLIRYDERGCGLSDWDVADFSFDAWVDDLELVVDAAGVDRFPLLGVSQGGAVAIAYAVRHPERVSHLILTGAYARGRMVRARHRGRAGRRRARSPRGTSGVAPGRRCVPDRLRQPVPARRLARAVGLIHRTAAQHDLGPQLRPIPRGVRPDRRRRPGGPR